MKDVAVFKVMALTEGGFVAFAPNYSQFCETLELAAKRASVKLDQWAKELEAEMREQAKLELSGDRRKIAA